jgi:hypothetical protein
MAKLKMQTDANLRIKVEFLFFWHGSQNLFEIPPAGFQIPL